MKRVLIAVVLLLVAVVALVLALNFRDEAPLLADAAPFTAQQVARGAYLARAGNCAGCHTERGGVPYAGGRGIATPFGTVFAPNLTPHPQHGLGGWTSALFWRAMHNGRSADGRLLYPVFPYTELTHITREDSDALFAYLRSLPVADTPNRPHVLSFPYDTQAALAVWRAAFFRPGSVAHDAGRSAAWNRGAYLVEGLGHCNACHSSRNALGASSGIALGGGLIPIQNWYAPSLNDADEAGVADWTLPQIVTLLQSGVAHPSRGGSVTGPMVEVVTGSLQHLSADDLLAMATYLKALPPHDVKDPPKPAPISAAAMEHGGKLYEQHCVGCHGKQGEGAPPAYPPLAGNRAVTMASAANLVHIVLEGGFAPSTPANPRPYGMPPFATVLSDAELASVLSHVRGSWGNAGTEVSPLDVARLRK
ncbi:MULTISPECIES: cytochrome c [unclassified Rhizobacter]|uniref:c-type cytochrome n=1 Tax=unclassified Rhizobacter TaxID=2640088 RepID=UPI0006F6B8F6|nr:MULTISPECIES: cytochrome c [unclassified Rhizobacter]KQU76785.1 alcohol dehydrogenase [Rhizobacter sp. Root29]KQV97305.1 alcohol dehydrogenase [Rhizobacter sp. Root1238]KRB09977.1 alcohol dehydrogenase [Rhizobacter sp. Root16D2]